MHDRRTFLTRTAAAGVLLPMSAQSLGKTSAQPLPLASLFEKDEEAYWRALRRQFLIPPDVVDLNNGTVGASPRPVIDAVIRGLEQTERMDMPGSQEYPMWGYGAWLEFRRPLAEFLGARIDHLALVRNATEANNYVANGLDLKAGDEVIISDEEHSSGEHPWDLRAKRYGIVIKRFAMPKPANDAAEILARINAQITPRTRIIFVSHISTVTGVILPIKAIAALARSKNILSAFDGAHAPGMIPLNLEEIGCDMYTGSLHKWLFAPKGTGFLYIREDVQDRVWNTIATGGWDDRALKAERFMHLGSSNLPILWGMRAAIEHANAIGIERIARRQRTLADYLHERMLARGAETWTSSDPAMRAAIVTVNVPPIARMELQEWLWANHKVRIRGGEPSRLRLSTPYYVQRAEIDRFLALFDEFKRRRHS